MLVMVTYHLEEEALTHRWALIATFGNDLRWVVGHYPDRKRAQHRIDRLLEMAEAQRQLEALD
jgi:hypothetical protein